VEHHGDNPLKNAVAIIPARYESIRLPGKMLLEIAGKPLILHTAERALSASSVAVVIVATDDKRIRDVVEKAGFRAVMTSAEHRSGSDRVAEAARALPSDTVIVNVQGDEPIIPTGTIDAAVRGLVDDPRADMATAFEPITRPGDVTDPNIVKVAVGESGRAVYFSRSPIPYPRDEVVKHGSIESALAAQPALLSNFKKHTGIYVYRREFLLKFTQMAPTQLEKAEMLEQLRALENGGVIKVVQGAGESIGVDTVDDLEKVRRILGEAAYVGME
jgi:3-deoxy-manno-octulosonate cytidylyltransferase (CMP-KDO synthetase)